MIEQPKAKIEYCVTGQPWQTKHNKEDCKSSSNGQIGAETKKVESKKQHQSATAKNETELYEIVAVNNSGRTTSTVVGDPEIFIVDTAATMNSMGSADGLINVRNNDNPATTVGNGATMKAACIGDLPVTVCDEKGEEIAQAVLTEVQVLPGSPFNLLSGTRLMKLGYSMKGGKEGITFSKGDFELKCNIRIHSARGELFAVRLKRRAIHETMAVAKQCDQRGSKHLSTIKAHCLLGHSNVEATRATAKHLGWNLTRGTDEICEACAAAKAKQKNLVKGEWKLVRFRENRKQRAANPNERIYLDISSVKSNKAKRIFPRRPHWCILVDERTGMKFSHFFNSKNGMVEPTCELFHQWKIRDKPVKQLRMDNAGENRILEQRAQSSDWKLGITVEYTGRDTPQHNHRAEVGLATIANKGRAMMRRANVPAHLRHLLHYKAFTTATKLDNLVMEEIEGINKTRIEHWGDPLPLFVPHLREWGEAGMVKTKSDTASKLEDKGTLCMFVGYAENHAGDVYEMLNWDTQRVLITRDVRWLNRMYFQPGDSIDVPNNPDQDVEYVDVDEDEDDDSTCPDLLPPSELDDPSDSEDEADEVNNDREETTRTTHTRSGRPVRAPTRLITEMTAATLSEFNKAVAELYNNEIVCVGAGIGGGFVDTTELHVLNYDQAMRGPDKEKWIKAVEEEHQRMVDNGVFIPTWEHELPEDTKIMSSTWAMKKKASGVFRARMVSETPKSQGFPPLAATRRMRGFS